jgi:hypothetical protein
MPCFTSYIPLEAAARESERLRKKIEITFTLVKQEVRVQISVGWEIKFITMRR